MNIVQLANQEKFQFWLAGVFSFAFYGLLILGFGVIQPDLDEHIVISENMFDGRIPAHPMFYTFIQLFSWFTKSKKLEIIAGTLIFSMAQWAKIAISRQILEEIFGLKFTILPFLILLSLQLIISFSLGDSHFIVNQICPNYFHNGTLACSIPFALLLFRESWRFAHQPDYPNRYMVYFGFLMALAKPSFLFCFIPLFPAFILYLHGLGRKLLGSLQVSLLLTFVIMGQSFYLRLNPPSYIGSFKVAFMPFYHYGTPFMHVKLVLGGLFLCLPLLLIGGKSLFRRADFLFILAMLVFAYGLSFNFVDIINGYMFSNMSWQTTIVLYLLMIMAFGYAWTKKNVPLWQWGLFSIFFLANLFYTLLYLFHARGMNTLFI